MPSNSQKAGLFLGFRPANERRCYKVTMPLIGWAQTWNQPWKALQTLPSVGQLWAVYYKYFEEN